MGIVVLARDSTKGQEVAIKLLKPQFARELRVVHRFLVEARHLQNLRHPNLVPVLESAERTEGPYFVMPYFKRGSLATVIKPGVPMLHPGALDLALDIA